VLFRLLEDDLRRPALQKVGLKGDRELLGPAGGPVQSGQALPAQVLHQFPVVGQGLGAQEEPGPWGLQGIEEGHPGFRGFGQPGALLKPRLRRLAAVGG
jgi:hypothetical protein